MPMKLEILDQTENKTLARKEIRFKVDHQGGTTPSRLDIRDKIVAQFNASTPTVIVRSLETKYGTGITEGIARIYESEEQLKRIELAHVVKRNEPKKKASEAE